MRFFYYVFLLIFLCQPLSASSYADSLDTIIDQKVKALTISSYVIKSIVAKIKTHIKEEASLQKIEQFLEQEHVASFFLLDKFPGNLEELSSDEIERIQQDFKDLQFFLGAQLYLYYLECCKQNMFYKAVKNYDTLLFWQNEKFYEEQPFYQKNILRSLSSSHYHDQIDRNIFQLQKLTQETNSFLGLVKHNQVMLEQAVSQEEFEQKIILAVKLQNDCLHIADEPYEICDMGSMIKKSIREAYAFSLHISEKYAQHQLPSHAQRHWKGYTLTSVGLCTCAFIYIKYGESIIKGSQHFWNEHIQGPLQQNLDILRGYTKAPQLPTDKHEMPLLPIEKKPIFQLPIEKKPVFQLPIEKKPVFQLPTDKDKLFQLPIDKEQEVLQLDIKQHEDNMRVLIEAGVKLPPARGDNVTLHEALVLDGDLISSNEFSKSIQLFNDKVQMFDEIILPIIDEVSTKFEQYQEFKKENPNFLLRDIVTLLSLPAFPDVYQEGSRSVADSIVPLYPNATKYKPELDSLHKKSELPITTSLKNACEEASSAGELLGLTHTQKLVEQAPDSSNWTFEQKKAYVEEQHKVIMANPYKNLLRVPEPYIYKIENESLQAKQIVNQYAQRGNEEILHGKLLANELLQRAEEEILDGKKLANELIQRAEEEILDGKKLANELLQRADQEILDGKKLANEYLQRAEDEILQGKLLVNEYLKRAEDEILPAKQMINEFAQKLHVIVGLTALIPVITVVGGSLFTSNKLYNSVAYEPLRKFTRLIEVYLNELLYASMSFEHEGHLYFLTEQLKMNLSVLTVPHQQLMESDIADLQSEKLDYVQKLNIIHRMYRTYPWLLPGTV